MSETMIRPTSTRTLVLNAADNVAVALANLDVGTMTPQGVAILRRVPKGHKFTIRPVSSGSAIVKFGQIIGFAKNDIPPGDWVHEHNCGMGGPDATTTTSGNYPVCSATVTDSCIQRGRSSRPRRR